MVIMPLIRLLLVAGLALFILGVSQAWLAEGEHNHADAFWRAVQLRAVEAEHYEEWRLLVESADVIIVGQVTDITLGRVLGGRNDALPHPESGEFRMANVEVEVQRVLRGQLPKGWILEIQLTSASRLDALRDVAAPDRSILFLRSKASEARVLGADPFIVEREEGRYRLVVQAAVLVEVDGNTRSVADGMTLFAEFEGRPFVESLPSVSEAAQE